MKTLIHLLLDPKIFNMVIMFLYVCAAFRWAFAKDLGNTIYWIAAFALTFSITFLMNHK